MKKQILSGLVLAGTLAFITNGTARADEQPRVATNEERLDAMEKQITQLRKENAVLRENQLRQQKAQTRVKPISATGTASQPEAPSTDANRLPPRVQPAAYP